MQDSKMPEPWTVWLLRIQYFLLLVLALGFICVRFSFLPFSTAFTGFGLALLSMSALAAVSFVALLIGLIRRLGHWQVPALKALAIGALPALTIILVVGLEGFKVPAIHDISTDTQVPPEFVAARTERRSHENTLDYAYDVLPQQQRIAYPDIEPLRLPLSTDEAFQRAQAVFQGFGWRILRSDEVEGVIEAVDETLVFGFKDDIIVRVLPTESGSQFDVRSVSRVGVSDLGANAKRIRRVLDALKGG